MAFSKSIVRAAFTFNALLLVILASGCMQEKPASDQMPARLYEDDANSDVLDSMDSFESAYGKVEPIDLMPAERALPEASIAVPSPGTTIDQGIYNDYHGTLNGSLPSGQTLFVVCEDSTSMYLMYPPIRYRSATGEFRQTNIRMNSPGEYVLHLIMADRSAAQWFTAQANSSRWSFPVLPEGTEILASTPVLRREVKPLAIEGMWQSSGWMGAAALPARPLEYEVSFDHPHSAPSCVRWSFDPSKNDSVDWAGVAYQYHNGNFGDQPGYDASRGGYTRLTFWARGEKGGEEIRFSAGGQTRVGAPYPDSFESSCGTVVLTRDWAHYSIPLAGLDLSNTVTAFTFLIQRAPKQGCAFYLDDLQFEGPE